MMALPKDITDWDYNKDRVSPYVYSGTNVYTKSKYVADGKFDLML